jgi:hypothetical protein
VHVPRKIILSMKPIVSSLAALAFIATASAAD